MARVANERSLELNITHQLLNYYQFLYWRDQGFTAPLFAMAPTIRDENRLGYDVALAMPYTMVFYQFKAPKSNWGADGREAHFQINNNSTRDQHEKLTALSGIIQDVYYAFPLVITDNFFLTNANQLINFTQFVRVDRFPRYSDKRKHDVQVLNTGSFISYSREHRGEGGITASKLIRGILNNEIGKQVNREQLSQVLASIKKILRREGSTERICRLICFHPIDPFIYRFKL